MKKENNDVEKANRAKLESDPAFKPGLGYTEKLGIRLVFCRKLYFSSVKKRRRKSHSFKREQAILCNWLNRVNVKNEPA